MKKYLLIVIFTFLIGASFTATAFGNNLKIGGEGYQCLAGETNRWKIETGSSATLPADYTIEKVVVKTGSNCIEVYPTNYLVDPNTGSACYWAVVSGNSVTVTKTGSDSGCQDISHLEGVYSYTSTSTTTTTNPCNGECCEISSWTCESCLEGPGTEGDKCFVTKWEYCKKEYGCDFVTDVTDRCDVEDCGEWSCPTDCKDISPSPEVSPTPTDEPEPTPTDEPEATPTPTSAPSNGGTGGPGDGLSDGRSDGLSSCPECTQSGVGGGQVLGASTGPTKAVLGLSTTSGENELIKLAQVFGSFILSMFGLAFYKKSA